MGLGLPPEPGDAAWVSLLVSLAFTVSLVTALALCTACCKCCVRKVKLPGEEEDDAEAAYAPVDGAVRILDHKATAASAQPLLPERALPTPPPRREALYDKPRRANARGGDSQDGLSLTRESSTSELYASVDKPPRVAEANQLIREHVYADIPSKAVRSAKAHRPPLAEEEDEDSASSLDPHYSKVSKSGPVGSRADRLYEYPAFAGKTSSARGDGKIRDELYSSIKGSDVGKPPRVYDPAQAEENLYEGVGGIGSSVGSASDTDPRYARIHEKEAAAHPRQPSGSSELYGGDEDRFIEHLYARIRRRNSDEETGGETTTDVGGRSSEPAAAHRSAQEQPLLPRFEDRLAREAASTGGSSEPSYKYITVRESVDQMRARLDNRERHREEEPRPTPSDVHSTHYYSTISENSYEIVPGAAAVLRGQGAPALPPARTASREATPTTTSASGDEHVTRLEIDIAPFASPQRSPRVSPIPKPPTSPIPPNPANRSSQLTLDATASPLASRAKATSTPAGSSRLSNSQPLVATSPSESTGSADTGRQRASTTQERGPEEAVMERLTQRLADSKTSPTGFRGGGEGRLSSPYESPKDDSGIAASSFTAASPPHKLSSSTTDDPSPLHSDSPGHDSSSERSFPGKERVDGKTDKAVTDSQNRIGQGQLSDCGWGPDSAVDLDMADSHSISPSLMPASSPQGSANQPSTRLQKEEYRSQGQKDPPKPCPSTKPQSEDIDKMPRLSSRSEDGADIIAQVHKPSTIRQEEFKAASKESTCTAEHNLGANSQDMSQWRSSSSIVRASADRRTTQSIHSEDIELSRPTALGDQESAPNAQNDAASSKPQHAHVSQDSLEAHQDAVAIEPQSRFPPKASGSRLQISAEDQESGRRESVHSQNLGGLASARKEAPTTLELCDSHLSESETARAVHRKEQETVDLQQDAEQHDRTSSPPTSSDDPTLPGPISAEDDEGERGPGRRDTGQSQSLDALASPLQETVSPLESWERQQSESEAAWDASRKEQEILDAYIRGPPPPDDVVKVVQRPGGRPDIRPAVQGGGVASPFRGTAIPRTPAHGKPPKPKPILTYHSPQGDTEITASLVDREASMPTPFKGPALARTPMPKSAKQPADATSPTEERPRDGEGARAIGVVAPMRAPRGASTSPQRVRVSQGWQPGQFESLFEPAAEEEQPGFTTFGRSSGRSDGGDLGGRRRIAAPSSSIRFGSDTSEAPQPRRMRKASPSPARRVKRPESDQSKETPMVAEKASMKTPTKDKKATGSSQSGKADDGSSGAGGGGKVQRVRGLESCCSDPASCFCHSRRPNAAAVKTANLEVMEETLRSASPAKRSAQDCAPKVTRHARPPFH